MEMEMERGEEGRDSSENLRRREPHSEMTPLTNTSLGEGSIMLRLRHNCSGFVEITVADPDRSNLLDVYVDLLEGAENFGIKLPEQPSLWYACGGQNFQLKNDNDLMNMFKSFAGKKLINLAIGSAESPCKNLELARGLVESKKLSNNVATTNSSHGTTSLRIGDQTTLTSLQLHIPGKKVPESTARKRGIYVPKVRSTPRSSSSDPTSGSLSRTDGVVRPTLQADIIVECSKCQASGHNTKTCKGGLTAKTLEEQGGVQVKKRKKKSKTKTLSESVQSVDDVGCSAPPGSQL